MPKSTSRGRGRPPSQPGQPKAPYRKITVYDAVAGRVSSTGLIPSHPHVSQTRDTTRTSRLPLPPQEILYSRRNAPERYEEDDTYWASDNLRPDQELPDSELLKAVHEYASDFYGYGRGMGEGRKRDLGIGFRSLDETALMCVGVLLEEMCEEVLGEEGDMVFVEAGEEGGEERDQEGKRESVELEDEGRVGKRQRVEREVESATEKEMESTSESDVESRNESSETDSLS